MKRFLFVDDNAAFAENLAEIVRDNGDEVTVEENGARAVERAREIRYDALVTDMRMPTMSGAELVKQIRQVDPGLPAIVVTAYTGEKDLLAALSEGLLAVLSKPVPISRLVKLLSIARRDGLIILVDDDSALADNLTESLSERGFSAVTATSVAEAERLRELRPFAAVVDLRMPGSADGAALKVLAARYPRMPILVMSGYLDALAKETWACWPRTFSKPFKSGELLAAVEALWH
jgi:two-component system, response regulator PdtaR